MPLHRRPGCYRWPLRRSSPSQQVPQRASCLRNNGNAEINENPEGRSHHPRMYVPECGALSCYSQKRAQREPRLGA